MEILLNIKITGESAEAYADVHPELIFEDFVGRHKSEDVELVSVEVIK